MVQNVHALIEIKAKINKWDPIKLTSFCTAKETINKTKRQPMDLGENICKWCARQGLNFQTIQTAQTTQQHKNNSTEKCAEDLNRHSPKKTYR